MSNKAKTLGHSDPFHNLPYLGIPQSTRLTDRRTDGRTDVDSWSGLKQLCALKRHVHFTFTDLRRTHQQRAHRNIDGNKNGLNLDKIRDRRSRLLGQSSIRTAHVSPIDNRMPHCVNTITAWWSHCPHSYFKANIYYCMY